MAATPLLGLELPVTGTLSGTWGDTVNNAITSLLDTAVAGTTTISTDTDVTLTTTASAANQARSAILLFTGARTVLRTIIAPALSKTYVVQNLTTGGFGVKLAAPGPTTGVTILNGEEALVAWNGSDFVRIATLGGPIVGSTGAFTSTLSATDLTATVGLTTSSGGKFTFAHTAPVVVTFSATAMVFDCSLSNVFTVAMTANVTVAPTYTNPKDGQTINIFLTQDATGSRTITWGTSVKIAGGTTQGTLSTAANSVDLAVLTYRSATTFWYLTLAKAFV
jgi:hypothetical protein